MDLDAPVFISDCLHKVWTTTFFVDKAGTTWYERNLVLRNVGDEMTEACGEHDFAGRMCIEELESMFNIFICNDLTLGGDAVCYNMINAEDLELVNPLPCLGKCYKNPLVRMMETCDEFNETAPDVCWNTTLVEGGGGLSGLVFEHVDKAEPKRMAILRYLMDEVYPNCEDYAMAVLGQDNHTVTVSGGYYQCFGTGTGWLIGNGDRFQTGFKPVPDQCQTSVKYRMICAVHVTLLSVTPPPCRVHVTPSPVRCTAGIPEICGVSFPDMPTVLTE